MNKTILTIVAICCLSASVRAREFPKIEAWITTHDRTKLFEKQPDEISFTDARPGRGAMPVIVDDRQHMQSIEGFGFALTGGSAEHLIKLPSPKGEGITSG